MWDLCIHLKTSDKNNLYKNAIFKNEGKINEGNWNA